MEEPKVSEITQNRGNAGMGRPKGSPNKATAAVREAIARMAEDNAPKFLEWMDQVAKTIAKVTSTHVTCTYADGSFCVPCVLMAC